MKHLRKKNLIGECKKLGIKIKCNDTKPNILKALKKFHENLDTDEEQCRKYISEWKMVYTRVDDIVPVSFDTVEAMEDCEQEVETNVAEVESVSSVSSVPEPIRTNVIFNDPTEYLNNCNCYRRAFDSSERITKN